MSWTQYWEAVADLTLGLRELGVKRGDAGGIMVSNRPEHVIADLALNHAGCVPVSLYLTLPPDQLAYVVNHSQAVIAVVENTAMLERLYSVREQFPQLRTFVLIEGSVVDENVVTWSDVLAAGRERHCY